MRTPNIKMETWMKPWRLYRETRQKQRHEWGNRKGSQKMTNKYYITKAHGLDYNIT